MRTSKPDPGERGLFKWLAGWYAAKERQSISKEDAHAYHQRSLMDGEVIRCSGEVIPKESV